MRYKFSNKLKGIFRVSASNLTSLLITMMSSFVLPYFISVEEYGYWQLFVLYSGYAGFFMLGFNDGIHLYYAKSDYNADTAAKFHSFMNFAYFLTILQTILLLILLIVFSNSIDKNFWILALVILNVIPVGVNGVFTYLNQSTLRFKQYAMGCVIDKIAYVILLVILLVVGFRDSLFFVSAYTVTRYFVIFYHFRTSNEVFITKSIPLREIKPEIFKNFKGGLPLMIATILNGSIIVGGQLLVKYNFGIEAFSQYSFSLHTLVIASQFITSITAVFYPIFKRSEDSLKNMYNTLDRASSLLAALLLLSYYPAALLVDVIYAKYSSILLYLYYIYPLFIFQCKSNLLIINVYKVRSDLKRLIISTSTAIIIHLIFVVAGYYMYGTVKAVAIGTLLAYMLWYYIVQGCICNREKWNYNKIPFDAVFTFGFILINLLTYYCFSKINICTLSISFTFNVLVFLMGYLIFKKRIRIIVHNTSEILKD